MQREAKESALGGRPRLDGASWFGACAALSALVAAVAAHAADPAPVAPGKSGGPVTLEAIPGSTVKRVTLTAKAAERLGIETGAVTEQSVVRTQMVSGLVISSDRAHAEARAARDAAAATTVGKPVGGSGGASTFGGFAKADSAQAPAPVAPADAPPGGRPPQGAAPGADDGAWLLVTLSPVEWDRLAKDKPVRLLPLATRDKFAKDVLAQPSGRVPAEDVKRSMLSAYYIVPGRDHGLAPNTRVRVELRQEGTEDRQKVVPYGAVYYDGKGVPWVYVTSKPLLYERQRIAVDRIVGDLAVLTDGPAVGTTVVTVGAPLLYGTEIYGK